MIALTEKNMCCGCRVCEAACPIGCIEMKDDENGFVYPVVDKERCIQCGRCTQICPMLRQEKKDGLEYFVGYAEDENIRKSGSSGGIFGAVAKEVIKKKGIVFGAGFDRELKLIAMSAESEEELIPLYRSKYIQCDMTGCYEKVLNELKKERVVLFCSTPCNCQALKNFLNKEYENLHLMDFVCHGVSSQELFDKSLAYHKKKGEKVIGFDFRSKEHKLNCSRVCKIETVENSVYIPYIREPYYYFYMNHISFRPSCYRCKYATDVRCSDITVSDYFTPKKYFKEADRLEGYSSIIATTSKGLNMIKNLELRKVEVSKGVIISGNTCLQCATSSKCHKEFENDYKKMPFEKLLRKYGYYSMKTRLLHIYYRMPISISKIIHRILIKE